MKYFLKNLTCSLIITTVIGLPFLLTNNVRAAGEQLQNNSAINKLKAIGEGSGSGKGPFTASTEDTLMTNIGGAIKVFLGLLGVVFIVLIILAGFKWMRSRGNKGELEEAGDSIRAAIIGLLITVGAYAIWTFLLYRLIFGDDASNGFKGGGGS